MQNATVALSVDVLLLDGALDASLGVTLDVLAAANRLAVSLRRPEPFKVRLVGVKARVRTGCQLPVSVAPLRRRPNVVVILGMNVPTPDELRAALARPDVRKATQRLRSLSRTQIYASCSATFVVAEAGLLRGRSATTSWWLSPEFAARFPDVSLRAETMVIRDGNIVTAGAALASVDLMLTLVRDHAGPQIADLCMRYLVVDERPSQGRYFIVDHLEHRSDMVALADAFAQRSLHKPIDVADLARAAHTTTRTLERHFRKALGLTPRRYLQRLRALRALHLIETSSASLADIAARVGYNDPVSLSRAVRAHTGRAPSSFRRVVL